MILTDHLQKNGPEWQFANCKWWSLKIWWSSWPVLSWRSPSCSRSDFILHLKLRVRNILLIIQFLVIYLGRRIMGSSCNVCLIDGEDLKKKLLRGRTLKSVPNSLDFGLNYFNKIWPYQIPNFLLLLWIIINSTSVQTLTKSDLITPSQPLTGVGRGAG